MLVIDLPENLTVSVILYLGVDELDIFHRKMF